MSDTIAAIATPRGEGGVAIIRISGPEAESILRAVCPSVPQTPHPNQLYLRPLSWKGVQGDHALVVFFRGPRSYTGEDVVEVQAHGGAYNAQLILSWVLEAGARLATPGEFTRRAFENGRIDLSQAEAIADLIAARSAGAHRLALRSLDGSLRRVVEALQDTLVVALAEVEACIDFPEEDLTFLSGPQIAGPLRETLRRCQELAATHQAGRLLREGAEVALVGRPNVGKSSLLNALLGEERAIVTEEAGTTRDLIRAELEIGELRVTLIDTAGLREVTSQAERIGVERARALLQEAHLRIVLLDGSQPLTEDDREILASVSSLSHLVVHTKSDLPRQWTEHKEERGRAEARKPEKTTAEARESAGLSISSKTGEGFTQLRASIAEKLATGVDLSAEIAVAHVHQRDALRRAAEALTVALDGISQRLSPELLAEELHTARDALGEITGRSSRGEILDELFKRFCIGK
jgi:tRNA modification GTPase